MSVEAVRQYLEAYSLGDRVREFALSSATVELAAKAVGVEPKRIAKTLSFQDGPEGCLLLVAAGDAQVDNAKFRHAFGFKARMLSAEEALRLTGHAVGGVCPFALPDNGAVRVYLDLSLRRFDRVYPAAGSANSAVDLTPEELQAASRAAGWVDVCKGWQEEDQA